MGKKIPTRRRGEGKLLAVLGSMLVILVIGGLVAVAPFFPAADLDVLRSRTPPTSAKIIMAPADGKCRQRLMDNQTGQFSDATSVQCEEPLLGQSADSSDDARKLPQTRYSVGGRADRIRESFTKR
jgi:hypothetical protein